MRIYMTREERCPVSVLTVEKSGTNVKVRFHDFSTVELDPDTTLWMFEV